MDTKPLDLNYRDMGKFVGNSDPAVSKISQPVGPKKAIQSNSVDAIDDGITPEAVKHWLAANPRQLERLALQCLDLNELREIEKTVREGKRPSVKDKPKIKMLQPSAPEAEQKPLESNMNKLGSDMMHRIFNGESNGVIAETVTILARAILADNYTVYVPENKTTIKSIATRIGDPVKLDISDQSSGITGHVATTQQAILVFDIDQDDKFGGAGPAVSRLARSILCVPLSSPDGNLIAVAEFTRDWNSAAFTYNDLQLVKTVLGWLGGVVRNVSHTLPSTSQGPLNDICRKLKDDCSNINETLAELMIAARETVNAECCAMVKMDPREGTSVQAVSYSPNVPKNNCTWSIGDQIASIVGCLPCLVGMGKIVNIRDAQRDDRYDVNVGGDLLPVVKSLLAIPISRHGAMVGAIELANKNDGKSSFNAEDEVAIQIFAQYASTLLHLQEQLHELRIDRARTILACEHCDYLTTCRDSEYAAFVLIPPLSGDDIPKNLGSFNYYDTHGLNTQMLPRLFIHMLKDLVPDFDFDYKKLSRFILTVRISYRPLAFHNFGHAFIAAQGMYAMLKRVKTNLKTMYTPVLVRILMVAAVCLHVDHRGYNNSFLSKSKDPLSFLYKENPLENYHAVRTLSILQREGHGVFDDLSGEEHKRALNEISGLISNNNNTKITTLTKKRKSLTEQGSNIQTQEVFNDVKQLMVSGSHLSLWCKTWEVVQKLAMELFMEYNKQYEEEVRANIPKSKHMQPGNSELKDTLVHHYADYVNPVFSILANVFHELKPLTELCNENYKLWKSYIHTESYGFQPSNQKSANVKSAQVLKNAIDRHKAGTVPTKSYFN